MNKTTLATILGAAVLGAAKQGFQGSSAKIKSSNLIQLFEFSLLSDVNTDNVWNSETFFDFFYRPKCRYSENEYWGSCGGWKSNKRELKEISKLGHDYIGSIAFTEVREGKFPPVQLYKNLESLYVQGTYGFIPEEAFVNAKWLRNLFLYSSSSLPQSTLNLTRLTNLGFAGGHIDCAVLENCLKLENLSISVERVSNLQRLGKLKNLKRLSIHIEDTSKNYDFSFISELTKLEEVRLLSKCHSTIHSSLSGLTKLREAKVDAIGDQATFDNLSMIPNLKELRVDQGYEYACLGNEQYSYKDRSPFTGESWGRSSIVINNFNNLDLLIITGRSLEISFSPNSCKKLKVADLCSFGSYYERESQGWGAGTKTVRYDNTIGEVSGLENLLSLEKIDIRLESINIWDKISEIQKVFYLRKIKKINIKYIRPSRWGHTEDKFVNIIPKNMSCTKLEHLDIGGIPVRFIPTAIQKCKKVNFIRIHCPVFDYTNNYRYGGTNDGSSFWPAKYSRDTSEASNFDLFIPKQIVKCKELRVLDIDGLNIYTHFPWETFLTESPYINVFKTVKNGMKTKEIISSTSLSDRVLRAILESEVHLKYGAVRENSYRRHDGDYSFLCFEGIILENYSLRFGYDLIPNINIASNDSRIKEFGINLLNQEDSYETPSLKELNGIIDITVKNEFALNNAFSELMDTAVIQKSRKEISLQGVYTNTQVLRNIRHIQEININSASIENLVLPVHSEALIRLSINFGNKEVPLEIQAKMLNDVNKSPLGLRLGLKFLYLGSVEVPVPQIKHLTSLKTVVFDKIPTMNAFPNWILSSKELTSLSFIDCPIPSLPENIGYALPQLKELDLDNTMVDKLPNSLIASESFEKLDIHVDRRWNDRFRRDFMITESSNPRLGMNKRQFISLLPYLNTRSRQTIVGALKMLVNISEQRSKSQLRRF